MADTMYDWKTNSKTTPYLTNFPERVRRGWFRSAEPDTTVTCENQSGAYIWMNGSANCRVVDNRGVYEWYFTIIAIGKWHLLPSDFVVIWWEKGNRMYVLSRTNSINNHLSALANFSC
jgi:hypothetical protein